MRPSCALILACLLLSGAPVMGQECEDLPSPPIAGPTGGRDWVPNHLYHGEEGGRLLVLGVPHLRRGAGTDSAIIISAIEMAFDRQSPDIALFEGHGTGYAASQADTIEQYGEPGIVRYLAGQRHIEARTMEPDRSVLFTGLQERFQADQILAFMAARRMVHAGGNRPVVLNDASGRPLRPSVIWQTARDELRLYGLMTGEYPDFLRIIAGVAGSDSMVVDPAWFTPVPNPARPNLFRDINAQENELRNRHVRRLAADAVASGRSVLLVIGRSHLFQLGDYFRCRFGQPIENSIIPP